ncbi:MAG: hypothetical protein P0Y56_00955 [Candidatus Andeanibacterium colombiense]|uniref:Uncharacterized protein n=1 Tax=Candidatus Andeanibacterium colombiense TaxID=3121345 RepID=A0AAJ6BPX0_9SPHN|nr:MAG: hypothetical protein P0Y56_00955 [Sphingomonadaceae bacterium]
MIAAWPCADGDEYALAFDRGRKSRLLVLPALFDEANKTRRLAAETMRRLDRAGIDSFLPDLPGCNESLAPLEAQTLAGWRAAAVAAANHFGASHVLTIRASAILAPAALPGWRYAPTGGASALRALLRARVIAAREAGEDLTTEGLLETGRDTGLDLAGYRIGTALIRDLEHAMLADSGRLADIAQGTIGRGPPWLRAEPDFDPAQADALAAVLSVGLQP